ncbi:MAG: 30S ribosomal protein S4 [Candidatus Diapherotrites archaeon]|nr:30S ribosomal protein S4 [Candidatus Diapherotrites archaeon]
MGDTRKPKKQYETPRKRWDKNRIDSERKVKNNYGLKNKKELRRIELIIKKKRENAKKLLALTTDQRKEREQELLSSLERLGVLPKNSSLSDVLGLTVTEFLERRFETLAWRKNFASTPKQARQFITHGHLMIDGQKITAPGYLVKKEEENKIQWAKKPLELQPKLKKEIKKEFEEAKPKEQSQKEKFEEAKPEAENTEPEKEGKGE